MPSLVGQHLDFPAARLGVFDVHAKQIAGEQSRLVAARAGAHLQNDVAFVGGVLRQQGEADFPGHRLYGLARLPGLGLGDLAHVGFERGIGEHGLEIGALLLFRAQRANRAGEGLQLRIFAREVGVFGAAGALAELVAEFVMAAQNRVEMGVEVHGAQVPKDGRRGARRFRAAARATNCNRRAQR